MTIRAAILFILTSCPLAAQIAAPPSSSATKATHVAYGKAVYAQALAAIAARDAEIAALKDIRNDVVLRLDAVAMTRSLSFAIDASGTLLASWKDMSDNESGFRVYRSSDGVTFAKVSGDLPANTTQWRDAGLLVGARYWYYVTAFNSVGDSQPSNTAEGAASK